MSPEVLKGRGYEFKSDVWSLGCVYLHRPHAQATLLAMCLGMACAAVQVVPALRGIVNFPRCILYELAMLRSPFKEEGMSLYQLFQSIARGEYPPIADVYRCAR
jgi:serine/threonine protein kinase